MTALNDIATISPSGRKTVVYMTADGTARAEVPNDHPDPTGAAKRALMLYLAEREWKAGEGIMNARYRMRDYLAENPPIVIGTGREIATGKGTIIYSEA